MKKSLSIFAMMTLLLSGLTAAMPGDLTPEEAMEKMKAKEAARRAATQASMPSELAAARAANTELRMENATLKEEILKLKAEIAAKDKLLAEATKKSQTTASKSAPAGRSIFDVDDDGKK
jgi:muconolactone delta-isomerase